MNDSPQARIFRGDARDLSPLRDGEVDLIVTSPPYWQIKDYGTADQIGYNQSLHDYLFDLSRAWSECFRVLRPGRRLCVVIGDQFARAQVYGRYKVIPLHCEVVSMCAAIGFDYMGAIIWQKKTSMQTTGGATIMGSFPHPPNGVVELDYEHVLLFKKPGEGGKIDPETKAASTLSRDEWKQFFAGHWNFGGARQLGHETTFPDELPRRLIKMFSFAGEWVFDPFIGSGTTAKVALELNRSAIGWELNPNYLALIKEKLCSSSATQIQFFEASPTVPVGLCAFYTPHIEDAHRLRDDKELKAKRELEPLWKVVDIVDERTVRLESGHNIALLGLQIKPEQAESARAYLHQFVRGQQVYVRFDPKVLGDEAYLVLKNKIFINRKMIEAGLATAAPGNYKWRAKFAALQEPRA